MPSLKIPVPQIINLIANITTLEISCYDRHQDAVDCLLESITDQDFHPIRSLSLNGFELSNHICRMIANLIKKSYLQTLDLESCSFEYGTDGRGFHSLCESISNACIHLSTLILSNCEFLQYQESLLGNLISQNKSLGNP
jgi:hypothetical protein